MKYKIGCLVKIKSLIELRKVSVFNKDYGVEITSCRDDELKVLNKLANSIATIDSCNSDDSYIIKISEYPKEYFQINGDSIVGYYNSRLPETSTKTPMPEVKPPKKPPMGLMPLEIWEEAINKDRMDDIVSSMIRYSEEDKAIPTEWIKELSGRIPGMGTK